MPVSIKVYAKLPRQTEDRLHALVRWLGDRYPLPNGRRYTMEIWPQLDGLCTGNTALIFGSKAIPWQWAKLKADDDSMYSAIAHEYRHFLQGDPEHRHERGVEAWASARVREARREGVI